MLIPLIFDHQRLYITTSNVKKCIDIIESKHIHDLVRCSCKSIFVDGGHGYLRRGGNIDDIDDQQSRRQECKKDEDVQGLLLSQTDTF